MTATTVAPIVLEVFGEPRPKGSKSAVVIGGRARVIEAKSANGRAMQHTWIDHVRQRATAWRDDHPGPLLDCALAITYEFWLPRPKSAPRRRLFPAVKPDYDKLARLVGDVLTGVIYADDALIVEAHIYKRYAVERPPGCTITITVI